MQFSRERTFGVIAHLRSRCMALFTWSLLCLCGSAAGGWQPSPPLAVPEAAVAEEAVEETRGLLDGGLVRPTRPWYDDKTDGIRRLDMRVTPQAPSWNLSWMGEFLKALGWFAVVLVVALIGLILWRVFLSLRNANDQAENALTLDDDANRVDRVEALPFRMARQATDPLSEAQRQYEKGNFNEAIIYLFSHQLLEMDKQHVIHLVRGKTNRQLVREVGPRRELRLLVEHTMIAFEDVFFGDHTLTRAQFEACWLELERFDRLVREAAV